ncbi:hypothetical protein [Pantoea sp. App145]|uniref:hypothetical protein n=1 Tax=Pantoea sp. App145 TaxID=3071567 RepID=UPI003A804EDA
MPDYITRQLALIAQHLKGWKVLSHDAVVPGNDLGQGEAVEASYLRAKRCLPCRMGGCWSSRSARTVL